MKSLLLALLALLAVVSIHHSRAEETKTVVCFGDSITKRGYPAILAENLGVRAINAGVAGHSSAQGLRRIEKDVLAHHPDVVVIFFGTNDARVDAPRVHATPRTYQANLNHMVAKIRATGAAIVICTLPPVNESTYFTRHDRADYQAAGGLANLWNAYRQAALDTAKTHQLPVVDLNRELLETPEWMHKDGIHPSPAGNAIIAKLVAKKVAPLIER